MYCRFPKTQITNVVDYRIDSLSQSCPIEIADELSKEKIFFIGGPTTSLDLIYQLRENKISFINIDKGYFRNRKSNSHWRMSFNSFQQTKIFEVPADRLENNFGISIKDWKKHGSYILILVPNPRPLMYYVGTEDIVNWALEIKNKLLNFTDRKIFIRFKNSTTKGLDPLSKYLEDCYAVVTLQSLGCVESIIKGVPVIALAEDSCANSLCTNKLEDIENLNYPDNRYEWLKSLSYGQFTTEEMRSGYAIRIIEELYHLEH
jgi:hypothetical protein